MRRTPEATRDKQRVWIDDMTRPRYLDTSLATEPVGGLRSYSSAGALFTPTSGAPDFTFVASSLPLVDQRVVMKFQFGGTSASAGILVKARSTALSILLYADPTLIRLFLGASGGGGALAAGSSWSGSVNTDYWLECSLVGNVLTGAVYTSDPDSVPAPTAAATTTFTLVTTNATDLGTGRHGAPGARANPSTTGSSTVLIKQMRFYAL